MRRLELTIRSEKKEIEDGIARKENIEKEYRKYLSLRTSDFEDRRRAIEIKLEEAKVRGTLCLREKHCESWFR